MSLDDLNLAIKDLTVEELKNFDYEGYSLLVFRAKWSTNFKKVIYEVKKIKEDYENWNFFIFDAEKDIELTRSFKIKNIPALVILKDKDVIAITHSITRSKGLIKEAIKKDEIKEWINSNIE